MIPIALKTCGMVLGIVLAAAGLPVAPGTLSARAVVSSGHRGAVLDAVADSSRGLLFTVGYDGMLRVWDTGARVLMRKIPMTRLRAQSIAVDPTAARAAVVVTDGARSFSVDVWDWESEKLLYRIPMESAPLFVRFSRTGTYLLCGEMRWKGLHVWLSRDGTPVNFHPEGFGMVGFAEASSSDATLMTYQPSGKIEYWDITSGRQIAQVQTVGDLSIAAVSEDRRSLVGRSEGEIVCLDAVTGGVRFRRAAPDLLAMDASPDADRVTWITAEGSLQTWSTADDSLVTQPVAARLGWRPRIVRIMQGADLLAGDDGQMSVVSRTGDIAEFARDILAHASGIAAGFGMLALAAGDTIQVFRLDGSDPTSAALSELLSLSAPCSGPLGLVFMDQQRLLVWGQKSGVGSLGVVDLEARATTDVGVPFHSPLAAVSVRGGTACALEDGGRIVVVDIGTGRQLFELDRPGAVCIAAVGPDSLVLGRPTGGGLQSSLVRIDLRSGETTALPGADAYTYALLPDAMDGSLYSLGVDSNGYTRLFHHEGRHLETESVIQSLPREFLGASIALDPADGYLYTSLEGQRVAFWTGSALHHLGDAAPGVRALAAMGGVVVALQRDSSVTLWDAARDRSLGQIFPFADGSWAAIMADESVIGVPAGRAKVGLFVQGRLSDKAGFTVMPPSQEPPGGP